MTEELLGRREKKVGSGWKSPMNAILLLWRVCLLCADECINKEGCGSDERTSQDAETREQRGRRHTGASSAQSSSFSSQSKRLSVYLTTKSMALPNAHWHGPSAINTAHIFLCPRSYHTPLCFSLIHTPITHQLQSLALVLLLISSTASHPRTLQHQPSPTLLPSSTPLLSPLPSTMATTAAVDHDVGILVGEIRRLGETQADGSVTVTFRQLFDDDKVQNSLESLAGTLKAAKRKKIIKVHTPITQYRHHHQLPSHPLSSPSHSFDLVCVLSIGLHWWICSIRRSCCYRE